MDYPQNTVLRSLPSFGVSGSFLFLRHSNLLKCGFYSMVDKFGLLIVGQQLEPKNGGSGSATLPKVSLRS